MSGMMDEDLLAVEDSQKVVAILVSSLIVHGVQFQVGSRRSWEKHKHESAWRQIQKAFFTEIRLKRLKSMKDTLTQPTLLNHARYLRPASWVTARAFSFHFIFADTLLWWNHSLTRPAKMENNQRLLGSKWACHRDWPNTGVSQGWPPHWIV